MSDTLRIVGKWLCEFPFLLAMVCLIAIGIICWMASREPCSPDERTDYQAGSIGFTVFPLIALAVWALLRFVL